MKLDTSWVTDVRGNDIAMQSDPSDETIISIRMGDFWHYFDCDATAEIIANLTVLLADAEAVKSTLENSE